MRLVSDLASTVLDYAKYSLADWYKLWRRSREARRHVDLKITGSSESVDTWFYVPILILGLLHAWRMAFNSNEIHVYPIKWPFPCFTRKSVAAALTAWSALEARSSRHCVQNVVLTMFCQGVDHLLDAFAIDDKLGEKINNFTCFVKLSTVSPLKPTNALLLMTLRCPHIYYESLSKKSS